MKKPEEIAKALHLCYNHPSSCGDCPYDDCENCVATVAKDAEECIMALVDKIPRWISVEDEQKPKHHKDVLCRYVFDGDSECFYAVLTYYAYGDNGYVTGPHFTGEGLHDMRVTHWMPLPEPPEEE